VVTVGGEGKNASALIKNGELRDYFAEESALTSARPISYTVRNLGDNSIAKVSETTEYNIVECTARPQTGEMIIDVTPNNADLSISGPGEYGQKTFKGDQILRELEPGGYTIRVEKLDDNTYPVETQEVLVVAGEVTDVTVVLNQNITPGGQFEVKLLSIVPKKLGCTWENEADLFWEFSVNGTVKAKREEADAIPRAEGRAATFATNSTVLDICQGEHLRISGYVSDADGLFNAPDRIATFNTSYIYHDIPEGFQLSITEEVDTCKATLNFSIERLGTVACPAKAQNTFRVSRRPLPLVIEETTNAGPEWRSVWLSH